MAFSDLPLASGRYHFKILTKHFGWKQEAAKKNHFVLSHPSRPNVLLSIPDHDEVKRGTLSAELKKAKIDDGDYRAACDRELAKKKDAPDDDVVARQIKFVCPSTRVEVETGVGAELFEHYKSLEHIPCHQHCPIGKHPPGELDLFLE